MRAATMQHQGAEQNAQMLALESLAGRRAELRADNAAHEQMRGEHDVDRLVLHGVQHRRDCCNEHDLEQRCADDHARSARARGKSSPGMMKPAADAHDRRHEADEHADDHRRHRADVELGSLETAS